MASSDIPSLSVTSLRGEGIESERACRILGVGYRTLMRLAKSGLIEWFDSKKLSWKRVRYYSIVDFCDRLRVEHKIADRRPVLSLPYEHHRDENLLPFPLLDTVSGVEALAALGYAKTDSLVRLIKDGCFDAYQLIPQSSWRVSCSSLRAYLVRANSRSNPAPPDDPYRYKVSGASPHF